MTQAHPPIRPLQGEALIAVWERCSQQPRSMRSLALLTEGCGLNEEEAAALSVPACDSALLALRRRSFGDALRGFANCRSCSERLEFTLSAGQIAQRLADATCVAGSSRHGLWTLHCRFATIADVHAAAAQSDLVVARNVLLTRCVSAIHDDGHNIALNEFPPELLAAADERLAAVHDAAELSVALTCPACEATADITLDLAELLWAETRHTARRLFADVHELAWAYGWSEDAILSMSAPRRAAYLALVRS